MDFGDFGLCDLSCLDLSLRWLMLIRVFGFWFVCLFLIVCFGFSYLLFGLDLLFDGLGFIGFVLVYWR